MHGLIQIISDFFSLEEDFDIGTFFNVVFTALKTALWADLSEAFLSFIHSGKNLFIGLGENLINAISGFTLDMFSDNWYYWILGLFFGVFIFKYIISAVIELISKLIDPM